MNERIKELKEQARDFYLLQEDLDCSTKQLHELVDAKFAELIIEECLRMCDCAEVSLLEHSYPREADGAASVKIFIKEYFGLEE